MDSIAFKAQFSSNTIPCLSLRPAHLKAADTVTPAAASSAVTAPLPQEQDTKSCVWETKMCDFTSYNKGF